MKLTTALSASLFAVTAAMIPRAAMADVSPLDLVGPIADYKIYVSENLEVLVTDTKAFTDAVKAGDLEKAKSLFGSTRMSYEAIEPIAELFSDLDGSIDSRADDHEKAEKDPEFTGFHRIEYGLFAENSTKDLAPFADKLMADVTELNKRITDLTLPPEKVVGGAAALMEEVAATKISGEEDRYSHTDLWDFKANFDGSRKIFELVRPLVEKDDSAFVIKVSGNFDKVDKTLAKYKTEQGYELYDKLTDDDRAVLAAAVNTLAEDLSTLRGKLGLN
ncbi:iron uptake system protein EfeO [Phyllobacterium endophyticum]|uniref:EfeM/EfeO family lipoprotein n=1 Tax=Phyllobacterium endophyticum TaxID=1149773 RepID=A0A2P7AMN7_9HYPH|nr:iron uptake system component EfeO [Phyllobacterium endophyticum]PSH55475.1 EfeM/EfeO family lipoprotein [Phyllobacterium endophyticum]TYR40209.1 iron uptake system protein EfeO [Phyllobacterium endophyticum]